MMVLASAISPDAIIASARSIARRPLPAAVGAQVIERGLFQDEPVVGQGLYVLDANAFFCHW
jgi:hypothetical protein